MDAMAAGGLGLLYSTSFLHAGFIGLGALWLASYLGHGGWTGHGALKYGGKYAKKYGGHGGGGGYGDYGGYYGGGMGGYGGYYGGEYPWRRESEAGNSEGDTWTDYKRRKRDLGEGANDLYERREEEHLVEHARDSDAARCSLRLVCELSAQRDRGLSAEEREILSFVSSGDPGYDRWHPGQGISSNSLALVDYQKAAHAGRRYGRPGCANMFASCPYSASDIMAMIRTIREHWS